MKRILLLSVLAIGTSAIITSCKTEGCTDETATNYNADADEDDGSCTYDETLTVEVEGKTLQLITGDISADMTLDNSVEYALSGGIKVLDGATLTISAGATFYALDDNTTSYLSIQRGGMIIAEGTASNPIVFTTETSLKGTAAAGDWGGIIVNGYATINTGATAEGEGGTGTYGGTDDADNSGTLKYVRVEYAGKILGTDNELNGFSFNGCGSGTTLEYLQAYMGSDDGFEFFGGTVSLKYAVSTGNSDDSFDWTHGWRGNGQFWVVHQSTASGDRGIEADNNGDDNGASPNSNPTLANLTLVGANDGDSANTGMRLREGTMASIYNAIVTGFPNHGIRVSDSLSLLHATNGDLMVSYSDVYGNGNNWKDAEFSTDASNSTTDAGLTGYVGTSASTFDPSTLGSWFTSAAYRGAVQSSSDWTAGWTKTLE